MVLIAISTLIGFATFTLIVTANRRQIRRLKRRLDTQAKTMIVLAGLIRDGDEPEGPVAPPPRAERHLHIVRDTAAIAVLALLLRRTAHAAREHPALTAVTVVATGVAVTAALLTLPGAPRRPGIALPTTTGLSSHTTPFGPATPPPPTTPPSPAGPRTPPQSTGTPQPSGTPPLPTTSPSAPPSSAGTSSTGMPQPSPTAPYAPGPSPTSTTLTTTRAVSTPPSTPPSTTPSPPPGPPPCVLALDIDNLIELKLPCP